MAAAVVSVVAGRVQSVGLITHAGDATSTTVASTTTTLKDPSPLKIEPKELAWTAGSFLVLLVLLRLLLYPRLKATMDARAELVSHNLAEADRNRASARAELEAYRARVEVVRAEAASKLEAARQQLEHERADALAAANARIADRRTRASAEVEAAKQAASERLADAVREVVAAAAQRALDAPPDPALVQAAVDEVMAAGVTR